MFSLTANAVPVPPIVNHAEEAAALQEVINILGDGVEGVAIGFADGLHLADGSLIEDFMSKIYGSYMINGERHVVLAGGVIVNLSAFHDAITAKGTAR